MVRIPRRASVGQRSIPRSMYIMGYGPRKQHACVLGRYVASSHKKLRASHMAQLVNMRWEITCNK